MHKMGGSTENLSCRGSSSSPSSSDDGTSTLAIDGEPKPSSGDLAKTSREQEQESSEHIEALLRMDNDTISNKVAGYLRQLRDAMKRPVDKSWSECYGPEQLTELHERLAIYRIIGHELSEGMKIDGLNVAKLKEKYPPSILYENGYFQHYEDALEWYFNPERFEFAAYDDYQRLVLCNNGLYLDWDHYSSNFNTYERDLAYVKYCEDLANETKCDKIANIAYLQAVKIALATCTVSAMQVRAGFKDHLRSIQFDYSFHKDFDGVYFELWKRVAKLKMEFTDALLDLYRNDMFPLRNNDIKIELDSTRVRLHVMKKHYDFYVACIDEAVPEIEAHQLIKEAVIKMTPKPQTYLDYARNKLQIAKDIGLITKSTVVSTSSE
uniref:Uncharacterized protein n=1 Tax=Leersia perrieri TaxID=77586 RepID=A0A0D9VAF8_9ORYZ